MPPKQASLCADQKPPFATCTLLTPFFFPQRDQSSHTQEPESAGGREKQRARTMPNHPDPLLVSLRKRIPSTTPSITSEFRGEALSHHIGRQGEFDDSLFSSLAGKGWFLTGQEFMSVEDNKPWSTLDWISLQGSTHVPLGCPETPLKGHWGSLARNSQLFLAAQILRVANLVTGLTIFTAMVDPSTLITPPGFVIACSHHALSVFFQDRSLVHPLAFPI